MKYKVGDVVVIRPDLNHEKSYGGIMPAADMCNNALSEAVITAIDEDTASVSIDIDGGEYRWSPSMFCGTKEEYDARSDFDKPFTLGMLDDLLDDIEVCVSVKTSDDAQALFTALCSRGYAWLGDTERPIIDGEYNQWEDDREDTVYWLSRTTVDYCNIRIAHTGEWDWVSKYTFQAWPGLEDFEVDGADALFA